jgi:asparagine synthase (glutamine-hydrolysing)
MCGIAGFMTLYGCRSDIISREDLDRMTDILYHRGPDSRGIWYDGPRGVGLGHRRLAIRDLSPAGAQPMTSSCGRYVIVYNGEIYSHQEIARDLQQSRRPLNGTSDTVILLEACAEWGVEAVLPRLIGMFAFALFDKETGEIILVRDRLGIKPLYWGIVSGVLIFGSELKALRAVPGWQARIDRNALAAFMRHNYIPAPHTIYQNVHKLEPGTLLRLGPEGTPVITRYWDLRAIVEQPPPPVAASDDESLAELDILLSDAVRRRMIADVPLGALLSGGIDSSLVAALMMENSDRAINTFSIGFHDKAFDEAPFARKIAQHLGTDHVELYIEPGHALDLVEKLPCWYDEPFADSSQIPTALVCELTRRHVTVVLSGDGGDEIFAGYARYLLALKIWKMATIVPYGLRKLLARGILAQPPGLLDRIGGLLPRRHRRSQPGAQLHRLAKAFHRNDPDLMYRQALSHWHEPDSLVLGAHEAKGILWDPGVRRSVPDFLDRMQFLDTVTYLPDDILTKVDRASMSVALEVRVPLLDHRIVEKAWSLPQRMKLRDGQTKWALRQALYRRVPRALIDRPKMGFGVPIGDWIRGPLRDWAAALLDRKRLESQGLFAPGPIRACWEAHLAGSNHAYPLWDVLMAQAWIDANPDVCF